MADETVVTGASETAKKVETPAIGTVAEAAATLAYLVLEYRAWGRGALHVTPDALELLVTEGYSLAYGARFLKRVIESRIKLPISQRWAEGDEYRAEVRDGRVEIEVARATGRFEALAATA